MDAGGSLGEEGTVVILIGQYDSPFVRRVGVALHTYGMTYDHWPWSTFGDADKLARYNPLRRVPTLVLEDGQVLIESSAILDFLDEATFRRAFEAKAPVDALARRIPTRRGYMPRILFYSQKISNE